MNKAVVAAVAFAGGVIAAAGGWWLWPPTAAEPSAAALMDAVMWNREPVGGPFALVDHDGRLRTDADFRGKLLLIYFGYTYCTDICPTDLQAMTAAIDRLGPAGDAVQPLFITVDPEHDTPGTLRLYVALFHPRLVGLTGSARQVGAVARAYKVYAARNAQSKKSDPVIDHSGFVFLVGRDGKYLGFFPPGTPADRIVDGLRPQLAAAGR
ncbi:MAG TPA: SCO family protein [Pseudolabrys sp.]|nr:SCO family protein [Pseudolabrys sp.]